jgi:DNA-binding GntR family transcriptional regulator
MLALTESDIEQIEAIEASIEQTGDVEEFLVLDRSLHWAMYQHHDADELAASVARLWDTTQHYRRAFTRLAGAKRRWIIVAEHQLLIQALHDRDVVTAQNVLSMHIRRTRIELGQHPELFTS